MGVLSVSMPEELIEQIDSLVERHDYASRSEFVRNATRSTVREFTDRQLEERPLAAVVPVLYPYDSPDIEIGLTQLRHECGDIIRSNAHSCLGEDAACLETFVLEGTLAEISAFVRTIETVSERIRVEHSLYPVEEIGELPLNLD